MTATYGQLLTRVLSMCDATGDTDATTVAQIALEETTKYVATKLNLRRLIKSKQATWGASTTGLAVSADFVATDFEVPHRLYVNDVPYAYREYLQWLDLKNLPAGGTRLSVDDLGAFDERPDRAWTLSIDSDPKVIADPVASGDVLTLFYEAAPAAYAASAVPEVPGKYTFLIEHGARLILREWQRDPDEPIDYGRLLGRLSTTINDLDISENSTRKRISMRISKSYR